MKMEQHLLRLLTGEFLHFHIIPNLSRFGEQFLLSYFMGLFHIEIFNSILICKADDDLTFQLRTVTRLVKQLDKLTHKNQEPMIKAYFKFLSQVFPVLLALFVNHIEKDP